MRRERRDHDGGGARGHGRVHGRDHAHDAGHAHDAHSHAHVSAHGHAHGSAHAHGHAHGHGHGHVHAFEGQTGPRLRNAFLITVGILALEAAGGWYAGSLALFSDAAHMLTDAVAVGLAWYASRWAERLPTGRFTYGFHRAGILAALFNAASLVVVSAFILYSAAGRLLHPNEPLGSVMMAVAAAAGLANLMVARTLGGHAHNLNVRGAWLHVLGDAAASAAVVLGGLAVVATGWTWVDPLLGVGIAALVLFGTVRLGREAMHILMEGAPAGLALEDVAEALAEHPDVLGIHDLHLWNLDAERIALTCHVVVSGESLARSGAITEVIAEMLRERFGIAHSTLQLEGADHGHDESILCTSLTGPAAHRSA